MSKPVGSFSSCLVQHSDYNSEVGTNRLVTLSVVQFSCYMDSIIFLGRCWYYPRDSSASALRLSRDSLMIITATESVCTGQYCHDALYACYRCNYTFLPSTAMGSRNLIQCYGLANGMFGVLSRTVILISSFVPWHEAARRQFTHWYHYDHIRI